MPGPASAALAQRAEKTGTSSIFMITRYYIMIQTCAIM
jgi:hypothetical protein